MSVESKPKSGMRNYRGRLIKVGILVLFSLLMMGVYVRFLQHPSPRQMLLNNRKVVLSSRRTDFGASFFREDVEDNLDDTQTDDKDKDNDDDDDDDGGGGDNNDDGADNVADNEDGDTDNIEEDNDDDKDNRHPPPNGKMDDVDQDADTAKVLFHEKKVPKDVIRHKKRELGTSFEIKMADYWEQFLKQRNFVPIGAVYDKCEGSRVQIGTVILMEDKETGGVKARTFVNITLETRVEGGRFNLESRYNGKALYDNYWELCEAEDDLPQEQRTFVCPLQPGTYSRVKDKAIPGYLPKGRFQSKIWATDQDGRMLSCGFSDFTI